MKKLLIVAAMTLLASACLQKETRHTLYLEPDGSVTWIIDESNVRSDEKEQLARDREEAEFLALARSGRHPVAEALRELGAMGVYVSVQRADRPFSVSTEGRFVSIEHAVADLLGGLGLQAEASRDRQGRHTRVNVTVVLPEEEDDEESDSEGSDVLAALIEEAQNYRIVLTDGKFVEATGFRLEQDDTTAVLVEPTDEALAEGVVSFSLTWQSTTVPARSRR